MVQNRFFHNINSVFFFGVKLMQNVEFEYEISSNIGKKTSLDQELVGNTIAREYAKMVYIIKLKTQSVRMASLKLYSKVQ